MKDDTVIRAGRILSSGSKELLQASRWQMDRESPADGQKQPTDKTSICAKHHTDDQAHEIIVGAKEVQWRPFIKQLYLFSVRSNQEHCASLSLR